MRLPPDAPFREDLKLPTDKPVYPEWDRNTRAPVPLPPTGSCDCQFHIYGDPALYPPVANSPYPPPSGTFRDMQGVMHTLGLDRGVIVYPLPYGTNHTLLFDTLRSLNEEERKSFRAIGIVKDEVSDTELEQLSALGTVGARFNIGKQWDSAPPIEALRRNMTRVHEIGWHARLHVAARGGTTHDLTNYTELFDSLPDVTFCIDHMAHLNIEHGLDQPAMRWIIERLKNRGWWMMLSNGNKISKQASGWDDAIPYARAFIEAAPDRVVWGTDWPHVMYKRPMLNDTDALELLYRYVDNDPGLIRKILVDNAARLNGF